MSQIHIRQVLALIDTYEINAKSAKFSIKFIKDNGELRFIKKAAKGYKAHNANLGLSKFKYNVKSKNIVIIRDLNFDNGKGKEKGRTISIKIDGIIEFNNLSVFH